MNLTEYVLVANRQTSQPLRRISQEGMRQLRIGTVYALVDPRNRQFRYVGYTSASLERRLREHLQIARMRRGTVSYHVVNWLNSLADMGLKPEIVPLETFVAHRWQEREQHWVDVLRNLGCSLTNTAKPGGGRPVGLSATEVGRPKSPEHRAKLAEAARKRFADPEERRRASEVKMGRPLGPYKPGRWRPPLKTHCPAGHPYTPDNISIRSNGSKRCRVCMSEQSRRKYLKRRQRLLVNGAGTPQTDADMDNARRIAES